MSLPTKSTEVPGQYLGYSLQGTRVLKYLLTGQSGSVVSLEVLDDVAVENADGTVTANQSKSTLDGNPISNRSIGLWKTLSNWVSSHSSGKLLADTTKYVIYVSKDLSGPIVNKFSDAETDAQVSEAIAFARDELYGAGKTASATIKAYVENFFANEVIARKIIANFSLERGSGSSQQDLLALIEALAVRKTLCPTVLVYLQGWVKKNIDTLLQQDVDAKICIDEFRAALASYVSEIDVRTVFSSTATEPTLEEQESHLMRNFVLQLDLINSTVEEKLQAISSYLRSASDRATWSLNGDVSEVGLAEYSRALIQFWIDEKARIKLDHPSADEITAGTRLFLGCRMKRTPLIGIPVPDHFTPGSYHNLAEGFQVGWHNRYKELLNIESSKED